MKRQLYALSVFFLSWPTLFGQHCLSGRYGHSPVFAESEILVSPNITYATKTHWFTGQTVTLQLDVYRPDPSIDTETQRPVVILTHGGSFMAGNRQQMAYDCMEYARRGYVAVTVTYRLGWGCPNDVGILLCGVCGPLQNNIRTALYAAVQDNMDAIKFMQSNASTYGVDMDWVFVGGDSAGAFTAIHTAVWSQDEANSFAPGGLAACGQLLSGTNNYPFTGTIRGIINNCGAIASTSNFGPGVPLPVVSFHDDGDCVVPYGNGTVLSCLGCTAFPVMQGSQSIYNYLNQQEVCTELNTTLISINHCSFPKPTLTKRAACFMKRTMCDVCTTSSNIDAFAFSPCDVLGQSTDPQVPECPQDLNGNGLVDYGDVLLLLASFGSLCP